MVWEHEGNRAVRVCQWKLVGDYPGGWELYDMDEDGTELNDLAPKNAGKVAELEAIYNQWADRCGVLEHLAPITRFPNPLKPTEHLLRAQRRRGRHVRVGAFARRFILRPRVIGQHVTGSSAPCLGRHPLPQQLDVIRAHSAAGADELDAHVNPPLGLHEEGLWGDKVLELPVGHDERP